METGVEHFTDTAYLREDPRLVGQLDFSSPAA